LLCFVHLAASAPVPAPAVIYLSLTWDMRADCFRTLYSCELQNCYPKSKQGPIQKVILNLAQAFPTILTSSFLQAYHPKKSNLNWTKKIWCSPWSPSTVADWSQIDTMNRSHFARIETKDRYVNPSSSLHLLEIVNKHLIKKLQNWKNSSGSSTNQQKNRATCSASTKICGPEVTNNYQMRPIMPKKALNL
jgi:hypothetical protein